MTKAKSDMERLSRELNSDGYTRFYYMAKLVSKIQKSLNRRVSILDFGGNSPYLYLFLKNMGVDFDLTVIDVLPCEEKTPAYKYIQGDAAKHNFEHTYDIVVTMDMLEHIDGSLKDRIVDKMVSTSAGYTIIAAPFNTKTIDMAEHDLNDLNKHIFAEDHRWLKEHFEMGKPDHSKVSLRLKNHKMNYVIYETNRIDHWYLSSAINLVLRSHGSSVESEIESVNAFYNKNADELDDGGDGYRSFYVVHKDKSALKIAQTVFPSETKTSREKELTLIKSIISAVQATLEDVKTLYDDEKVLLDYTHKEQMAKLKDENANLHEIKNYFESEYSRLTSSRLLRVGRLGGKALRLAKNSPGKYISHAKKAIANPNKAIDKLKDKARPGQVTNQEDDYKIWQKLFEPSDAELQKQGLDQLKLAYRPLISIITPVFNPPKDVLIELIESVLSQTYDNFELCLGSFSTNSNTKNLLNRYSKKDSRIKVKFFDGNWGIGENSNKCLKMVNGEYIALLDHDDTISPDALFEVAKKLNESDYDFIYSDKDMINEDGERYSPFFKPGYSPELMYSANYLTHLNIMKTDIVKKVGGWNPKTDGAQDWDLFLRVLENTNKIAHIPKVLYHWRVLSTSTAFSITTKPYALEAQKKSVTDHLSRIGHPGSAYHLEDMSLAVTWNSGRFGGNLDILVLDNHKFDESVKVLKVQAKRCGIDNVRLHQLSSQDEDYSGKFNSILKSVDKLLIVGPNAISFSGEIVEQLLGYSDLPGVVASSPQAVRNEKIYDAGSILGLESALGHVGFGNGIKSSSPYGYAAWNRNFIVPSKELLLIDVNKVPKEDRHISEGLRDDEVLEELFIRVCKSYNLRTVCVPNIKVEVEKEALVKFAPSEPFLKAYKKYVESTEGNIDSYYNPNLTKSEMSVRIKTSRQDTSDFAYNSSYKSLTGSFGEMKNTLQNDSTAFSGMFDIDSDTITESVKLNADKSKIKVSNVYWLVPQFTGVYAGINNILYFASYLQKNKLVKNHFVVLGSNFSEQRKLMRDLYPDLANRSEFSSIPTDGILKMKDNSVGVASQWTTAYVLAKSKNSQRNFYFIQDYEPDFYAPGTSAALAENTYKFGFWGIANTPGLKNMYAQQYKQEVCFLPSRVDLSRFSPKLRDSKDSVKKVFFYARPFESRNAFELGIAALKKLKEKHGNKVEIYCAGQSGWKPEDVGAKGYLTNLGKISLSELPKFYANLDAGLVMMFSHHPGVVPSELMSSGVPVVVNSHDEPTWNSMYKHGKTAYVATPTASCVFEGLDTVLSDDKLKHNLSQGGIEMVRDYYKGYDEQAEKTWLFVLGHKD